MVSAEKCVNFTLFKGKILLVFNMLKDIKL